MVKKKFYVTTPIYYPNDIPHIGHAYTTIAVDVLARWNKVLGNDVFFLTGTDDHGKKIADTAEKFGKRPRQFVDDLIPKFKEAWKKLNIDYDRFIRTTDKEHEKVVSDILKKVYKKGDIYLGEYEGLYCTGCEAYYTEKDLIDGKCPIHKKPVDLVKEKSYFFKLSKYQKGLLELYKKNPNFISPEFRKLEIINRVKEGLRDLSISRTNFDWGIPLPFDKKHVCYVWFDALFNYYSATRQKGKEKYWPANLHLIGKDISWFHCVYWPAFLMSAGIKLPEKVFAHGWWTFDKEKISKSVGKVINVEELINIAGVDSARYFLLRETSFGNDGDFSESALISRHNNELADKLGNLISRVSTLIEKNGLKKTEINLLKKLNLKKIEKLFENLEFDKVLNEIFGFVDICNEYIQNKKPWEEKCKDKEKVLYEVANSIKAIAILLWPFIPSTSEQIAKEFGFKIGDNSLKEISKPLNAKFKIKKSEILFKKIESSEQKSEDKKINKFEKHEEIMGIANIVEFNEWEKIELRVAEIKNVEEIPGADKLWKLTLDVGELGTRIVCAGIKEQYTQEKLKGKKLIYFANLKPRMMKGIESQGMILAAVSEDHKKVILISPEKDIDNGSRVS